MPASAMLTADTVRMVTGAEWRAHPGGSDECVIPEGAVGLESVSYGGTDAGAVVETVATYPDDQAAESAVAGMAEMAKDCGWKPAPDPRLGSASAAATDGSRALVAVASEGVVVMLVGSGKVTKDEVAWGSLVDLALGTSCAAAPDGCH